MYLCVIVGNLHNDGNYKCKNSAMKLNFTHMGTIKQIFYTFTWPISYYAIILYVVCMCVWL